MELKRYMSGHVASGTSRLGRLLCSPIAPRPAPRCSPVLAVLRQQQLELAEEFRRALAVAQHETPADSAAAVHKLVTRGVTVLEATPDWRQLVQAFEMSAKQCNLSASTPAAGLTSVQLSTGDDCTTSSSQTSWGMASRQPGKPVRKPQSTNSAYATPRVSSSTATSRSPWGFAIRQPDATASAPAPAASISKEQADAEQWCWSSVQHFVVLGLGSLGQYVGKKTPLTVSSSRLGFRLFQLVLAVALWKYMLPGLIDKPTVYDPEFDQFDQQLLTKLGFQVVEQEPSHKVVCKTLVYMPCCPRQLYSQVLEANWNPEQLHQLAIFGTSMRSLADTQTLFESLTAEVSASQKATDYQESGTPGPMQTAPGRTASADGAPSSSKTSSSSSSSSAAAAAAASSLAPISETGTDFVNLAYREGIVVEVMAPDCAAHGVGVAVHLFCN